MKIATTKERIIEYIDYKGINIQTFLKETGIKRGFLDGDKLSSTVSDTSIANIIATYPEINLEWLVTGKGEMLKHNENIPVAIKTSNPDKGIPLIPIDAMAGFGNGEIQLMDSDLYEHYVIPAFRSAEFLIQVKGSSMYPKYASGDLVACKKLHMTSIFFQWNKVYVLDTDQGALIKRVQKSNNPDYIILVSDNESYPPFDIHLSHIYSIAIVVGVIRLE